jgi:hypothetical protein
VRNRLTAERDQLRDRLAEAQQREATAIASWDEERNRALREGGRVVEWRDRAERAEAEVERLKAALAKSCDDEREMSVSEGFPHGVCGLAEELTARAERAEAELEEARKETCITQSMETPTMKTYSPIQGMHVCSNDTGDYVGKADYDKIEAELAKYVQHEPNLLNTIKCMEHQILAQQADLAFERARLDWLLLDNVTRFEVSYHDRAAIDAAMKEGARVQTNRTSRSRKRVESSARTAGGLSTKQIGDMSEVTPTTFTTSMPCMRRRMCWITTK